MPATTRTERCPGLPDQRGEQCPQPACPEHVKRVGGWTIDRSRTSPETLAADAGQSAPGGGPDLPEGSRSIRRDDRTVLKPTRRTCAGRLFTAVDHNCGKLCARFNTILTRSARPSDEMRLRRPAAGGAFMRRGGPAGTREARAGGRGACCLLLSQRPGATGSGGEGRGDWRARHCA